MDARPREPVSRRGQPPRPALSRAAIIGAGLQVADGEGLNAVTMRRVAAELDTSASALYVYIRSRDDLLDAMFDHVMAEVAEAPAAKGTWQERLSSLLIRSVRAASGHGGLAQVTLSRVPAGPSAEKITGQVKALLAEGQLAEAAVPAALDLLALFVTAAALDRVPTASFTSKQRQARLRWEIDVILNGLSATKPEGLPGTDGG
jgi:AcrR family transcriptional regulator